MFCPSSARFWAVQALSGANRLYLLWDINSPNAKIVFNIQNNFYKLFGALFAINSLVEPVCNSDGNDWKRV